MDMVLSGDFGATPGTNAAGGYLQGVATTIVTRKIVVTIAAVPATSRRDMRQMIACPRCVTNWKGPTPIILVRRTSEMTTTLCTKRILRVARKTAVFPVHRSQQQKPPGGGVLTMACSPDAGMLTVAAVAVAVRRGGVERTGKTTMIPPRISTTVEGAKREVVAGKW